MNETPRLGTAFAIYSTLFLAPIYYTHTRAMPWWFNDAQPSLAVSHSRSHVIVEQSLEEGVTTAPGQLVISAAAVPQLIEHLQTAAYRILGPDLRDLKTALPRALLDDLHPTRSKRVKVPSAKNILGSPHIELLPREQLRPENLRVRPQLAPWRSEGPHKEDGYYAVPGVNLVEGSAKYALVWLPIERRFGTYDPEHTEVMIFRGKPSWPKLSGDINRYFAATNNGGDIDTRLAEYLCPWPTHPFVPTGR
jgi:hypothetical protein